MAVVRTGAPHVSEGTESGLAMVERSAALDSAIRGLHSAYTHDASILDIYYKVSFSAARLRELFCASWSIRRAVGVLVDQVCSLPLVIEPLRKTGVNATTQVDLEEARMLFTRRNREGETFLQAFRKALVDFFVIDQMAWIKTYTRGGRLVELWPVDAASVVPIKDERGILRGYVQKDLRSGRRPLKFYPEEIVWIVGMGRTHTKGGIPIIQQIFCEAQTSLTTIRSLNTLADVGYIPPTVITTEERMDEDSHNRFLKSLETNQRVRLLEGVKSAKIHNLMLDPDRIRLLELSQEMRRIVYEAFGLLPPEQQAPMPRGSSKITSFRSSRLLEPTAQLLSSVLTANIGHEMNVKITLAPRPELASSEVVGLISTGVITINEARSALAYPSVVEGDVAQQVSPTGVVQQRLTTGTEQLAAPLDAGASASVPATVTARSHNGNGGDLSRELRQPIGSPEMLRAISRTKQEAGRLRNRFLTHFFVQRG